MWREKEITNFKGIQHRRTPEENACSDILNLDPRGSILGDLTLRTKVADFLAAPTDASFTPSANLALATITITQPNTPFAPKEVTVLIQSGTVASVGGSSRTKKVIAVFCDWTYYLGSWLAGWNWVNRVHLTSISAISGNLYAATGYAAYVKGGHSVYTAAKGWDAVIGINGSYQFYLTQTGYTGDCEIHENYFPSAALTANADTTVTEAIVHQVISDLRAGFGGQAGRLGMGMGIRKKYFNMDTSGQPTGYTHAQASQLDKFFTFPFNNACETNTFKIAITGAAITAAQAAERFPQSDFPALCINATVVFDDFQEFLIPPNSSTCKIGDDYGYLMNNLGGVDVLKIKPEINFATMNRRITAIKFYAAKAGKVTIGTTTNYARIGDYVLVKEIAISDNETAQPYWTFGTDGYLKYSLSTDTVSNEFVINYEMYKGGAGLLLNAILGYTATNDYLQSWDQALMSQGRVHYLNGYIDTRYMNKIFRSHISGAGAYLYDVVTAEEYSDFEQRNGDDAVGVELLNNLDIAIFKQSSIQRLNTQTGYVTDLVAGVGCVARKSIVNYKDKIIFASENGIYLFDGIRATNIIEGQLQDIYDTLSAANKAAIVAVKDELGNCYRMYIPAKALEYLYVPNFGWTIFSPASADIITNYVNSADSNLIYYLTNAGTIKKITATREMDYDPASVNSPNIIWESVWFDIATLGENIGSSDRLFLRNIWLRYVTQRNIKIEAFFDYSASASITKTKTKVTADETNGYHDTKTLPVSANKACKAFKIRITCGLNNTDTIFTLKALGFSWTRRKIGLWG